MPRSLTTRFVGDTILSVIPDGNIPVPFTTLRQSAERLGFLALVDYLAFGSPQNVSRVKMHFTARASGPAEKTQFGVKVAAQPTVTFDLAYDDQKLRVFNITGVKVKPFFFKEFPLVEATFTTDGRDTVFASTRAWGWFPVRLRLSSSGIEKM